MKKTLLLIAFLLPILGYSQVVCTSQSGQNAQSIIENFFIGEGG